MLGLVEPASTRGGGRLGQEGAQIIPFHPRRQAKTFRWWAINRRMLVPKTVDDYLYWIGCAEEWLLGQGTDLRTASHQQLLEYFDTLKPTYSVRKNVRCALVAFYAYLAATGERADDPAADLPKLKRPKAAPKPLPHDLIPDFLQIAYKHRRPVLPCLCVLYLNTGLRLSELCTRRKTDRVDDYLFVTVKGGSQRAVFLNRAAYKAQLRWEQQRNHLYPDTPWMFPSPRFPERHISPEWVYEKIRDFGREAGIEGCRPHRLRHTFATTLYAQTRDILLVKEALGHADLKNTLVYTQAQLFGVRDALENLSFEKKRS